MPELPEVNTVQHYFRETSLHKQITHVIVQDDKIIRNMDGDQFAMNLSGQQFVDTYRQGKYFFGELENGHSVLFHLGMTGDLKYYHNEVDQPKYERFAFHFADGSVLGFDCPRKFARILYLEDRQAYVKEINLGIDALRMDEKTFLTLTKGKKSTIKGFLLNQHYIAGVGNLYADEICFQTKVHPASKLEKLNPKTLKLIFKNMQSILQEAVDRLPHYKQYPPNWFWEWRVEGNLGPNGKGSIEKLKVAGRTTYFATKWQKLYE